MALFIELGDFTLPYHRAATGCYVQEAGGLKVLANQEFTSHYQHVHVRSRVGAVDTYASCGMIHHKGAQSVDGGLHIKITHLETAAVMNLAALRESGQWDTWWNRSAA